MLVVGGSTDVPSPGALKRVGSAESLLSKNNSQSGLFDSMYHSRNYSINFAHKLLKLRYIFSFCTISYFVAVLT